MSRPVSINVFKGGCTDNSNSTGGILSESQPSILNIGRVFISELRNLTDVHSRVLYDHVCGN